MTGRIAKTAAALAPSAWGKKKSRPNRAAFLSVAPLSIAAGRRAPSTTVRWRVLGVSRLVNLQIVALVQWMGHASPDPGDLWLVFCLTLFLTVSPQAA
jgi:hypothetical protein